MNLAVLGGEFLFYPLHLAQNTNFDTNKCTFLDKKTWLFANEALGCAQYVYVDMKESNPLEVIQLLTSNISLLMWQELHSVKD